MSTKKIAHREPSSSNYRGKNYNVRTVESVKVSRKNKAAKLAEAKALVLALDKFSKENREELDKMSLSYDSYINKYGSIFDSVNKALERSHEAIEKVRNDMAIEIRGGSPRLIIEETDRYIRGPSIEPIPPLPQIPQKEEVEAKREELEDKTSYRSSGSVEEILRLERENKKLKYMIANLEATEKQFIKKNKPVNREKDALLMWFLAGFCFIVGMLYGTIF